ncbi:two-component system sensor histidine kinase KdpD [Streptomonospora nanhaiensis]|uniref:histidine kinase n=1 Tax=Streptomonospora nanhaiensis TaxID=1323731 RepID=A0A853BMV1_9ACTN|nr:two-component system sensor histidine kinase KdpD [Streptomonospora nanhaiensis]
MARSKLRIYLGAAPGVGKTYSALSEARRRRERGTDVVVGLAETRDRPRTAELLEGLEVLPRARVDGAPGELDLDALLARAPRVAVVDDFAHTNAPGTRNAKRWQDVEELLNAGIDVITTLNIQHVESLNDVVERITGVRQRETIPDQIVRRADQIELCDMSPHALRRRMSHGNIYPAEKIDAALSSYFREGNLTALRELALLWVADRVDEGLAHYRGEHKIRQTWEARERVVVALTGGPEGETLIRRAARVAARSRGGRPQPSHLMAVHVVSGDNLAHPLPDVMAEQRRLLAELGGTYHQVIGKDIPTALLEFARGVNATQIVLGSSRRRSWQYAFGPGVGATVARESGDIDVHIVTHEEVGRGRNLLPPLAGSLSRARHVSGWAIGLLGPVLLAAAMRLPPADGIGLAAHVPVFFVATIAAAMVGGLWPALVGAVWSTLLLDLLFAPPLYGLSVHSTDNTVALAAFILVGVLVAFVVDLAKRRALQASRSKAEASTLSLLASSVIDGQEPLPALLRRIRETFGQRSVALLRQEDDGAWTRVESVGEGPCASPDQADALVSVSDSLALALRGHVLPAADRRILGAFATHIGIALERQRLAHDAAEAKRQAARNKIRTALLAAVSHDLRTPLTSIKASVSSLRSVDIELDEADRAELLENIEESTDRLNGLVGNLLDMSRLQTDTVQPKIRAVGLEEVVPATLIGIPPHTVCVDVPDHLPRVRADAGLLERAVANVVQNAARHNPPDSPPILLAASALGDTVELRVADHGPGVPDEHKDRIFEAFQRLGDAPRGTGIGLGLAVARGFTEAMDGTLIAEDTPGGGLTMVFTLHTSPTDPAPGGAAPAGAEAAQAPGGGADTHHGPLGAPDTEV